MFYYLPIILTVVSNVLYHCFLKLTPANVNPILSLTVTYATAMVLTLVIYPFFPNQSTIIGDFKALNWTSWALGFAIVGLEVGFILAYRWGWPISLAGVVSNIAVAMLLIPLGLLFFKETLNVINAIGFVVCLIGLVLVNYKG